jgi:hypothetical protein
MKGRKRKEEKKKERKRGTKEHMKATTLTKYDPTTFPIRYLTNTTPAPTALLVRPLTFAATRANRTTSGTPKVGKR